MKTQRTESEVILALTVVLCNANATGVAIEPIATMEDPDDEITGDYTVRACFTVDKPDGFKDKGRKRYCLVFEASITMDTFMRMDEARFINNLASLQHSATEFRDEDKVGKEVRVTTSGGTTNMGRVVRKAQRESPS